MEWLCILRIATYKMMFLKILIWKIFLLYLKTVTKIIISLLHPQYLLNLHLLLVCGLRMCEIPLLVKEGNNEKPCPFKLFWPVLVVFFQVSMIFVFPAVFVKSSASLPIDFFGGFSQAYLQMVFFAVSCSVIAVIFISGCFQGGFYYVFWCLSCNFNGLLLCSGSMAFSL